MERKGSPKNNSNKSPAKPSSTPVSKTFPISSAFPKVPTFPLSKRLQLGLLGLLVAGLVIVVGTAGVKLLSSPNRELRSNPSVAIAPQSPQQRDGRSGSKPQSSTQKSSAKGQAMKYGHLPYAEAKSDQLITIASYGSGENQRFEQMDQEAGAALLKMIFTAREEGVWIVPVSAYRDLHRQEGLFQRQIERQGSPEAAAKVSAPPGHSEHHTGYAVDLTDGSLASGYDITLEFETTQAFVWLEQRAKDFGFQMSFPENNQQGVIYEPWHWRYVGSPRAQTIFAEAMRLFPVAELTPQRDGQPSNPQSLQ